MGMKHMSSALPVGGRPDVAKCSSLRRGKSLGRGGGLGFTLVELLIAMTLSAFLIGALIVVFSGARGASQEAEALSRIQENTRFASEHLLRDIRMAGFRDQLTLRFPDYVRIGSSFAWFEDDNEVLVVRYAGRNHCAEPRRALEVHEELRVVENRYFADAGELVCEGRRGLHTVDADGDDPVWGWDAGATQVTLAAGISDMSFTFIGPDGALDPGIQECAYETDTQLEEDGCLGVRISLDMVGLRGQSPQSVDLTVAFRNIVVDRIYGR